MRIVGFPMGRLKSLFIAWASFCNVEYLNSTLQKLAHAINRDFLALKIENFQLKKNDIFLIFAQNRDCGYTLEPPRRGGSNEYPQSMF